MTLIQQMRRTVKKFKAARGRHDKEEAKYFLTRNTETETWRQMEAVVADLVVNEILSQGVWLPCDVNGNVPTRSPEKLSGNFAHYRRTVSKAADFIRLFEDVNYHKNNINVHIELPEPPCGGVSVDFRVDYDKMSKMVTYRININVWGGAKIALALKHLGMSIGDTVKLERRLQRLRQLRTKVNEAIKATTKRFKLAEATTPPTCSSKKAKKK